MLPDSHYDKDKADRAVDPHAWQDVGNVRRYVANIADALTELPQRTRYAFEMYRLHGVPQKDIAKELGVSPTLVNFMIRDALVHCRKVSGNHSDTFARRV